MSGGRAHLQAARWAIALGRVTTALFVLGAIGSSLVAWASWSAGLLLLTALYAGLAAGWHALLAAFDRHGRGAWAALVVWSAAGAGTRLGGWLLGADAGVLQVVGGLLDAALLGLLLHPDSREWVARPPGTSSGRPGGARSPQAVGMAHAHRRPPAQAIEELP